MINDVRFISRNKFSDFLKNQSILWLMMYDLLVEKSFLIINKYSTQTCVLNEK